MAKIRKSFPRTMKIGQLVREECANWVGRSCVWGHPCYIFTGKRCSYFEEAVLPAWPEKYPEYERLIKGQSP